MNKMKEYLSEWILKSRWHKTMRWSQLEIQRDDLNTNKLVEIKPGSL